MAAMKATMEVERERFEAANRHIVATEERIDKQRRRIAQLKSRGARSDESERLLTSLLDVLGVMQRYRQQVLVHLVAIMSSQEHLLRPVLSGQRSLDSDNARS